MEEKVIKQMNTHRPQLLSMLAILSFIGSGLSLFSNITTLLFYNTLVNLDISELTSLYPNMFPEDVLQSSLFVIEKAGRLFFVVSALAYMVSLYGVYKMWKLQKDGLHYYAISQLIILLLPLIFVSTQMSVLPGLLLTTLFILLYYRSFKLMEDEA